MSTPRESHKSPLPEHRPLTLVHVVTVPLSLRFLAGQTRFLQARGFRVHSISAPGPMVGEFAERERATTHTLGLTRTINPVADTVQLAKLWRLIRRLRPDIVHSHTPKGGLLGTMAARLAGVPVRVYHARGLRLETMRGASRLLLTTTERIACGLATDVLCNSQSLREEFVSLRLCHPKKIRILRHGSGNGVDAKQRFNPSLLPAGLRQKVRQRHGIPENALLLGFVGRIVRDKGIVELAEAWQRIAEKHPQARLLLVGPFEDTDPLPEGLRQRLEQDSRVHLVPFTESIVDYYAAMDVLVLPTYREGFANALLEAGAMGLPSVASRVTGCVDPIREGVTGRLVPPRNAEALADALDRYLSEPESRASHGQAARQRVQQLFAQEPLWQAQLDFYHEARTRPRQTGWQLRLKQLFDRCVAGGLLVASAPVLGATSMAVAVNLGRPVLFKQQRIGRGQLFSVFKFRTMREALGPDGRPLPDAERLTRTGQWLRRLSLDELPQLFNVLRGEMSLVGPRPLLVQYLERYSAEQARRHSVLPGITGWAAIHGRNATSWPERFQLDTWYVDHWSLWLDVEILARTVFTLFKSQGISQAGHATMPEFMGNHATPLHPQEHSAA